ncbi:MAG TPA: polymer-forming cytoskeletal protein [Candidatus Acidoferrales bacterium]|jgi:cytoskeletal protein CcmA (bactofilin family)|nr:polymer-forming cytoskeletal protein [Candidatus Acidoferrales bacterium]HXQ97741.1 polymer-forming cytoskeletal protein [Candidatus Limnocylindrales bacterium]
MKSDPTMAWPFSDRKMEDSQSEWSGFLDRTVRFEGTLEFSGTLRIEAQVKGNILSNQTLVLGEGAKVEGQIEGNQVIIAGRFDGVIFAKGRVEIQARGVVSGEIHSPCLVIEPGGIFDGRCHMTASSQATKTVTIPFRAANQG